VRRLPPSLSIFRLRDVMADIAEFSRLKYYTRARLLVQDITECRDLTSLQALLFMILFLQATSNLSACYAFIGIALRAALRMGLHRHLPHAKLTPIEHESRRRVFYVVRQMDTYVSALLGFPLLLRDDDIDQPLPTEVDDEFITKETILTPPAGTPSFFEAFNAHTRLMGIMAKVIKHIYPMKGIEECVMSGDRPNATYMISYARIKEIECELHEWYEQLPIRWRPSQEGPIEFVRYAAPFSSHNHAGARIMSAMPGKNVAFFFIDVMSLQDTDAPSVCLRPRSNDAV